jgi:hypothetical protein
MYRGQVKDKEADEFSELFKSLEPITKDAIQTCFGNEPVRWLHLLELWDYIAPEG